MKITYLILAIAIVISLSGLASASWVSHAWKEVKHEVKSLDWHFTAKYSSHNKIKSFDNERCGTYFWDVQDRKHCYKEWKEKGVYIRGW